MLDRMAPDIDEHLNQFEQVVTTVTREFQTNVGGQVTSQIIQQITVRKEVIAAQPASEQSASEGEGKSGQNGQAQVRDQGQSEQNMYSELEQNQ